MASPLPRFCSFKSSYNKKYLYYVSEEETTTRFLQFSGDEVVNPFAKFQVEIAKINTELLHIRCCYNNKYWVRQSKDDQWIVAAADQPEEDQSKWSCTLFKPIYLDGDDDGGVQNVRFVHVQLGNYACLWRGEKPTYGCLIAGWNSPNQDLCDVFTVINWESLVVLPQYVAFKSDNNKYLMVDPDKQVIVCSGTNNEIDSVQNEVITAPDGSISFKNFDSFLFWTRNDDDHVAVTSNDVSNNNPNMLFWPIKVASNVIALRNVGNNKFCCRNIDDQTFKANALTISQGTQLQVEELVLSRKINNVNFRLDEARVYNESMLVMARAGASNDSEEQNEVELSFSYTESSSSTWDSTLSLKLGFQIEFESGIPRIFEGKIKISGELGGKYEWGATTTSTEESQAKYNVKVSPKKKATVTMLVTQGTCDVPFSYYQHDTLTDGNTKTYVKKDGVYTGINCYNFNFDVEEEKL